MSDELSTTEAVSLFAVASSCIGILLNTFQGDGEPLIASIAFSGIAFAATYSMVKWLGKVFLAAGLKGIDMSKIRKTEMCVLKALALRSTGLLTMGMQVRRVWEPYAQECTS